MEQPDDMVLAFIAWGLYPAWLVAGGCDYLCHRATDIGHTSGPTESWLHLAQFGTLFALLGAALLMTPSLAAFGVMIVSVIAHTGLSVVDVAFTTSRRRITVLEQFVHGFMNVIPCVAVALLMLLQWPQRTTPAWRDAVEPGGWLILATFIVVAGLPILEELVRTHRQAASHRASPAPLSR
ncbi:MAG TPA: hypothetical protein VIZ63_16860 [Povalibacter sp.]